MSLYGEQSFIASTVIHYRKHGNGSIRRNQLCRPELSQDDDPLLHLIDSKVRQSGLLQAK